MCDEIRSRLLGLSGDPVRHDLERTTVVAANSGQPFQLDRECPLPAFKLHDGLFSPRTIEFGAKTLDGKLVAFRHSTFGDLQDARRGVSSSAPGLECLTDLYQIEEDLRGPQNHAV